MDTAALQPSLTGTTPAAAISHFAQDLSAEDSALQRRYSTPPAPLPVVFEFSRDPALLHQYYILRERLFISTWGLKEFHGEEDEADKKSDILIIRQGNFCIGGARLIFTTPGNRFPLPMEDADFNVKNLFPELDLENKMYGECSRMALLPEFRTKEFSFRLRHELIQQCLKKNVDYVFWISPLVQARNYRQTCVNLGYSCKIRTDIEVPDREEYEGIKMYMVVLDFTKKLTGTQPATILQAVEA